MNWMILALVSAALYGVVSIFSKVIAERKVRDVRTFYIVMGLLNVIICAILLLVQPIDAETPLSTIAAALAAGVFQSSALMLMWFALRTEEVSRVIPVTQTFPIFVALIAALLLEESLDILDWVAIGVTVVGAVLISARRSPGGRVLLSQTFLLMVLSSLSIAVSHVFAKVAVDGLLEWNLIGLYAMGGSVAFCAVALRTSPLKEAYSIVRNPRSLAWFLGMSTIGFSALWLLLAAFAEGPVSLASTLVATRSLFLFVFTVLLSRLMPKVLQEPQGPRTLLSKLSAITMILGGTTAIVLG